MAESLLARVKTITACSDKDLAAALSWKLERVRSYVYGRRREYLNAAEITRLTELLRAYVKRTDEAVQAFELLT